MIRLPVGISPFETVKSVSYDQHEILRWIKRLHCNCGFDVDLTYGNGKFYAGGDVPTHCFDIEPLAPHVVAASSCDVPLPDNSVNSVVFDPPFITYVQKGRKHNSVMAKRFGGYHTYAQLEDHYRGTLRECSRILRSKGVLVFKCQDIIHNHRMHATHTNVINWAEEVGFRLVDLFVLPAKHRMPGPQKGTQRHARIYHSYFLVLGLKA